MLECLQDPQMLMRAADAFIRAVATQRAQADAQPASGKGSAGLCITATDGSYPTVANRVYRVTPQELDADDLEGAAATATGDADQDFYAVNLGSQVPPQGTQVIVTAVGGRWAFRYDGGS